MEQTLETAVVIVGGSIVGLTAALCLAQRGVPFLLIERHLGSSPHPRALGYTARTMEIFRSLGIDKDIPLAPAGFGGKPRRVKTDSLNGEWHEESQWTNSGNQPNSAKPGVGRDRTPARKGGLSDMSDITPVSATPIAQDKLEPIIRDAAIRLGADLRLGCQMTEWSQDMNGVLLMATDPIGNTFHVKAKYMIACDGAGSRIRQDLGKSTTGVGYMRTLRSILFRCPSIDHYLSRGISQWSISNGEFESFLVTYSDGRWALMSYDEAQDALDAASQKAMICKAIGEQLYDIELITQGKWDLVASIAESFSSGRVFLAGDAAHSLPPNRGGYGANTGIADVHNLAWKLQAVLSGKSKESLLASYDEERRPVALVRHDQIFARDDYKAYVEGTKWEKQSKHTTIIDDIAMELGQIYRSEIIAGLSGHEFPDAQAPSQWQGQPGTRAPHLKMTREGEPISILDYFGAGWVLVSKDRQWISIANDHPDVQFVHVGNDAVEVLEGAFLELFGINADGASLIRPDGFVAARWAHRVSADDFSNTLQMVAQLVD